MWCLLFMMLFLVHAFATFLIVASFGRGVFLPFLLQSNVVCHILAIVYIDNLIIFMK